MMGVGMCDCIPSTPRFRLTSSPLHHGSTAAALGSSPSPGVGRPRRQVARGERVVGLDDGLSRTSTLTFRLCLPRILPVTPVGPCLPGHRSTRPYTIFELEQVRQQSRKYGPRSPAQGWVGGSSSWRGTGGPAGDVWPGTQLFWG